MKEHAEGIANTGVLLIGLIFPYMHATVDERPTEKRGTVYALRGGAMNNASYTNCAQMKCALTACQIGFSTAGEGGLTLRLYSNMTSRFSTFEGYSTILNFAMGRASHAKSAYSIVDEISIITAYWNV